MPIRIGQGSSCSRKPRRLSNSSLRSAAIALAASFIFLTAVLGVAEQQAASGAPQTNPAADAPPAGIAVTEVAARATEVANLIQTFNAKLAVDAGTRAICESLPDMAKLIDLEGSMTAKLLREQPPIDSLERQQSLWRQRQIVTTTWLNVLTERATLLEEVLKRLAELEKTWTATRVAVQTTGAPEDPRADRRHLGCYCGRGGTDRRPTLDRSGSASPHRSGRSPGVKKCSQRLIAFSSRQLPGFWNVMETRFDIELGGLRSGLLDAWANYRPRP